MTRRSPSQKTTLAALTERVATLEAENERRLDEIRRLLTIVQSQSETLQTLFAMIDKS